MADRFLSFDGFGPYRAGGIIDAISERLEREGGDWNLRYPVEAQCYVDDEVELQIACRVARFLSKLDALCASELAELGTPQDIYLVAPMSEAVCESLDLAHDLCADCARTFPTRALDVEGRCPACRKEP